MKNMRIYWMRNEMRADGNRYDQLFLETKRNVYILLEKRSKK